MYKSCYTIKATKTCYLKVFITHKIITIKILFLCIQVEIF